MYCVKIKDANGQEITVEVSFEVYQLFEDERRELERERFERRVHLDSRELDDYIEADGIASKSPEDHVCLFQTLNSVLQSCTLNQQIRFSLFMRGYSISEIARLQRCTFRAVQLSLSGVLKKIKKFL